MQKSASAHTPATWVSRRCIGLLFCPSDPLHAIRTLSLCLSSIPVSVIAPPESGVFRVHRSATFTLDSTAVRARTVAMIQPALQCSSRGFTKDSRSDRKRKKEASRPQFHRTGAQRKATPAAQQKPYDALTDYAEAMEQKHRGIFQSQHIKPFPVRAAIDIGTGGAISLAIARVDAQAGAIQKMLHQTQLPLYLEKLQTSSGTPEQHNRRDAWGQPFVLSERSMDDIGNKMRVLAGVLRRNSFEGISERAAVMSWPLCLAQNAQDLAHRLTREFKVDVRALGRDFDVAWPPSVGHLNSQGERRQATDKRRMEKVSSAAPVESNKLKELLQKTADNAQSHHHVNSTTANTPSSPAAASEGAVIFVQDPKEQLDTLAFLAHAASSQCVAPQRLVIVSEDPQRGLRLLGLGTSSSTDVADLLDSTSDPSAVRQLRDIAFGSSQRDDRRGGQTTNTAFPFSGSEEGIASGTRSDASAHPNTAELRVVEHRLPLDVATAHRYCITQIQRRPAESYHLHTSSPNPVLADEFIALRDVLADTLTHDLPAWVRRKSLLGGVIAGTSHNGGMLNLAARVAQQSNISLDHLEVHAQHHFCGLTDVLLADSFPNPLLVLPSAALSAALMRALQTPRITYLPEVNIAAALLTQPTLWMADRIGMVRARLSRDPFYAAHTQQQRGRTFERPHRKDQPTAAPEATWVMGGQWNMLSYEESMKGT